MIKKMVFAAAIALSASVALADGLPRWLRIGEDYATSASDDVSINFGCTGNEQSENRVGIMSVVILPQVPAFKRVRNDADYTVNFFVDGKSIASRSVYARITNEEVRTAVLLDGSYVGREGDYGLWDVTEALRKGKVLTIEIPQIGLSRTYPLTGSSRALEGIYLNCGMRPTGTGVVD